jgi:bacterioferritin
LIIVRNQLLRLTNCRGCRIKKAMIPANENVSQPNAVALLNDALKNALTGINQYFLHARMLKHKSFMRLADYEYKESLNTMKYTDQLVNLVLTLGGVPNLQELGNLRIGETVPQMLANDLALVEDTIEMLQTALENGEQPVLVAMLASEEKHLTFLRSELNQIDSVGINSYLQTQV